MKFRICQIPITDSTNSDAKKAAEAGEPEGLVIQANRQTAGKGRQGRNWESPEGNLYASILLRPKCSPQEAGHYSFIAALAVHDTISSFLPNADTKLKWPNDVLVNDKKISGILLETELNQKPCNAFICDPAGNVPSTPYHSAGSEPMKPPLIEWLIIGIGINILHYPESALYPTTSLSELLANPTQQVQPVLDILLQNLQKWRNLLLQKGFSPIRSEWLKQAKTGRIIAKLPNETIDGFFYDLDNNGNLILRLETGSERAVSAGEVFFS